MRDVRVAAVQMESAPGDRDANFKKVAAFAADAAVRGVEILVCPECCLTGYWFLRRLTVPQLRELAEPVPDGSSTWPAGTA
jgi:predicted amidohydrolase